MNKTSVLKLINKLKNDIKHQISDGNYEDALCLIKTAAWALHDTNVYYTDNDLEKHLEKISSRYFSAFDLFQGNDDTVVFYDGLGFNRRGLAYIYLHALAKHKRIIYITLKNRIEYTGELKNIVEKNGVVYYLDNHNLLEQASDLYNIVKHAGAKHFFFYAKPYDVAAIIVMHALKGKVTRYLINLTDHAFWLGAKAIDYCINFRNYGASIDLRYRELPKEKIVLLPMYPAIDRQKQFKGFPFEVHENTKVFFSGGYLYKTFGDNNLYYRIVEKILVRYPETVFWYAGSGDPSEISKLMRKYPDRVYLTEERDDLYQVLKHCYFYLSTYPICGGLMYQYAAEANCVPLTLRNGSINDDMLFSQETLGIDFDTPKELFREIDKIMKEPAYRTKKNQSMSHSVIKPLQFEEELLNVLKCGRTSFEIRYKDINTESFRSIYLKRRKYMPVSSLVFRKEGMITLFHYYPVLFLIGGTYKVLREIRQAVLRQLFLQKRKCLK